MGFEPTDVIRPQFPKLDRYQVTGLLLDKNGSVLPLHHSENYSVEESNFLLCLHWGDISDLPRT